MKFAGVGNQPALQASGQQFYERRFDERVEEPKRKERERQRHQEHTWQRVALRLAGREPEEVLEVGRNGAHDQGRPDQP